MAKQPSKPETAKHFVRVTLETYRALIELQAARAQKETKRPTLGDVVASLLPKN